MGKRSRNVPVRKVQQTDVDVCILVHKEFDYLPRVLEGLKNACKNVTYTVYLLSNGNTRDEYAEHIADLPGEKYFKENMGFPRGNNFLVNKKGSSPYVLFLNSDVILQDGAVDIMLEELKQPNVGLVGCKLIFPTDGTLPNRPAGKVQHAGLEVDVDGTIIHTFIGWSPDVPKVNVKRDCFAVTGAVILTSRQFFRQVGGFFEGYGLGTMEDVDLCVTTHKAGKHVMYVPEAWGYHYTGASAIKSQTPFPIAQNYQIFGLRHPGGLPFTEWLI